MPPHGLSPSNKENMTNADYPTRRRRTNSKEYKLSPTLPLDDRHASSPSNMTNGHHNYPLRSPTAIGGIIQPRRRKTSRSSRLFRTLGMAALDILILGYMIRSIFVYFQPTPLEITTTTSATTDSSKWWKSKPGFQKYLPDLPACDALDPDEVTFTLAVHLSGNLLWMMQHHCQLWGTSAPISVAVWTTIDKEEILSKLTSMGCHLENIHLQVLSSEHHWMKEYPINQLRNMALSGAAVSTSHVLLLDVDFWETADLFDTLNSPAVRTTLSKDPKLALVLPAFELQNIHCHPDWTVMQCRSTHLSWMPRDFEDLVINLGNNKSLPYDPTNYYSQGSTNYRQWMRQDLGELGEISCVLSNSYQPYLVLRLCDGVPPFQEQFTGHGRNNMAWMMHLRRLGYSLQQIGGSFVTHYPHPSSLAKQEWDKLPAEGTPKTKGLKLLRGQMDETFVQFKQWLDTHVDDEARLEKCEDFVEDEDLLWTAEEHQS